MADSADKPWPISVIEEVARVTDSGSDFCRRQKCSIYRVSHYIRRLKPNLFDCVIVPLGLYNGEFRTVTSIDELKLAILSVFLKHLNVPDSKSWCTFCAEVAKQPRGAPALEDFYDGPPTDSLVTPEFVRSVLVIDAVVIAALFHPTFLSLGGDSSFVFNYSALADDLAQIFLRGDVQCHLGFSGCDIWLFENQIPLFLIENVLKAMFHQHGNFQFDNYDGRRVQDAGELYRLCQNFRKREFMFEGGRRA